MGRIYFDIAPFGGYPAGPGVYYECGVCEDFVPSIPRNAAACACRNIVVDADAGRVSVKDHARFRAFRTA
ncbi:hypothetical protein [Caulobacter sp. 17J65-9]|uniref:hypothetical protein n=1 Tax=Caulobacter sp. 17J65-9 TaxID=2709382 RepID=UPI0013CCB6CF|nr:hypothetical protein [Caulobacter sp. 17J65-9]NEX92892.1 hypothetical protein [Caulobacter sp. 17J65-9]